VAADCKAALQGARRGRLLTVLSMSLFANRGSLLCRFWLMGRHYWADVSASFAVTLFGGDS